MSETKVRKNETIDAALRRFKRSIAKDGVLAEVKKPALVQCANAGHGIPHVRRLPHRYSLYKKRQ